MCLRRPCRAAQAPRQAPRATPCGIGVARAARAARRAAAQQQHPHPHPQQQRGPQQRKDARLARAAAALCASFATLAVAHPPPASALPVDSVRLAQALDSADGTLTLNIALPDSFHYTPGAPSRLRVLSAPEGDDVTILAPEGGDLEAMAPGVAPRVAVAGGRPGALTVGASVYFCADGGACYHREAVYEATLAAGGGGAPSLEALYEATTARR